MTMFCWFTGIMLLVVLILDVLLGLKFNRYFRANGYGIVTVTLVSLVIAHAIGALIFGATAVIVAVTGGKAVETIHFMKELGSVWLISSSLLHVMSITFQRMLSCSLASDFIDFTRSKTNIGIITSIVWVVPLIVTILCITTRTAKIYSIFYFGLFITGCLSVLNFTFTVETAIFKGKSNNNIQFDLNEILASTPQVKSKRRRPVRVVSNPRKTFNLFSGLVFLFVLFIIPTSIPNLIFTLRKKYIQDSTSLIVSLWLFLGIVFNSLWIAMRLRSTINDTSGFYARWTLNRGKHERKRVGARKALIFKNDSQESLEQDSTRRNSIDSRANETEMENILE